MCLIDDHDLAGKHKPGGGYVKQFDIRVHESFRRKKGKMGRCPMLVAYSRRKRTVDVTTPIFQNYNDFANISDEKGVPRSVAPVRLARRFKSPEPNAIIIDIN